MNYNSDDRIVMTLDAGGTNFVFSAIQGKKQIIDTFNLPSCANDLEKCLHNIVAGFDRVRQLLSQQPVAISFAFPGPSDYKNGIIGDLANLPAFRGGIALGPMLEEKFELPAFINNDGDLFAYGEAIAGFLPWVNDYLKKAGRSKRYKNLLGITLGTGFGGGIVHNGELFIGDNSAAGEIWVMRNKKYNQTFAEEGVSIRAVQRVYAQKAGVNTGIPTPKEIYEIALNSNHKDKSAAISAFEELGEITGDALANAITLIDGLIVIGGGLAGAYSLFASKIMDELNGIIFDNKGNKVNRLEVKAFNLEDKSLLKQFLKGDEHEIIVPGTNKKVVYDPVKRIGFGLSKLGTSEAVSIGAYAFALNQLDKIK